MVGRGRRTLSGLVGTLTLVGAALTVPSAAQPIAHAAVSGTLVLDPATPILGERPVLSGKAPSPAGRVVKLQVRRPDGTWRGIDRRLTRADRSFRFRLDRVGAASRTVRVLAPATDATAPWRSDRLTVTPTEQHLTLIVPTEARAGENVWVTALATPARPGRYVAMWVNGGGMGGVAQDALGRAVFHVNGPTGEPVFSATTLAHRGAAAVDSDEVALRVTAPVTGIPRVDIVTDDGQPITSSTDYKTATVSVDPRGSGVPSYSASAKLRVRGNFTATVLEKLPYRLKLGASTALAGMPSSKDWVLLAGYFDRSLLRTTLGMEVGRRMRLPWSPRMVDVEVRLNGELMGLYQLGESIKVDGDRADIELADEDATDATGGGFLLEVDVHDDDEPRFVTSRGLQAYVKEPEDATDDFVAGVGDQLEAFEDALYSPGFADPATGYARLIDRDSFVDWYLANELVKNVDAGMMNSVYLSRSIGGRLAMGPPWDFDISAGNRVPWEGISPTGWFVRHNWYGDPDGVPSQLTGPEGQWFVRLFQDPAFEAAVRARWVEVSPSLRQLPEYLARRRTLILAAAQRNFTPVTGGGAGHPIEASVHDPEFAFKHWRSYDETTAALTDWLTQRLAWMDGQLSSPAGN
jgi:hypothetical protein